MFRQLMYRANRFIDRQGAWKGACWGLSSMMLIDGITYLIFGNVVAGGPSFSLLDKAPGGIRFLAVPMTALGLALMFTTRYRNNVTKMVLFLTFVMGIFIICYIIGGWVNSHQVAISTATKWFLLAWLGLWLSATTWRQGRPNDAPPR